MKCLPGDEMAMIVMRHLAQCVDRVTEEVCRRTGFTQRRTGARLSQERILIGERSYTRCYTTHLAEREPGYSILLAIKINCTNNETPDGRRE